MIKTQTEILVIGGGATGTGILRDLAMRGFQAILVERRDLTHGTTGRFHGLLHSGGRYAVKDPEAARECIQENRILRKIMPHCIEDTGGFFVLTPDDDPKYVDQFIQGCREAGIPTDDVSNRQMLNREVHLNPDITRCLRVPDGAADGFAAAHANIASAQAYGAQALTYHEVISLMISDRRRSSVQSPGSINNDPASRVVGAICHDLVHDELVEISADLVVNAAGAWVGKIGESAGVEIAIRPGKGTMIAVSQRIVNTVINRLKMPSDGDILVPAHTVAVMGTTDEQVPDPDNIAIEPWEIQHMLSEGEKIIPGFSQLRMLRAWAGVRPLYQETKTDQSRDITRSFVLLDHEERDNLPGLLTITSGKWTTYRKMAEVTVDKVCEKLNTQRACRTHLETLPAEDEWYHTEGIENGKHQKSIKFSSSSKSHYHSLGHRLAEIEHGEKYGELICECELATRNDIEWAIIQGQAITLDDIRRDVRLGMGPCQGGFCTIRAAGILHQLSNSTQQSQVYEINASIRDFLQERWKGVLPILWGQQLRQESLNELILLNVLNIDKLPGPFKSRLGPDNYLRSTSRHPDPISHTEATQIGSHHNTKTSRSVDTLIIGAGLAGLTAAWQLAARGQNVRLVSKGWGATHWASGCIDVLGYYPINNQNPIGNPVSSLARLTLDQPRHPYAQVSLSLIESSLKELRALCAEAGYPLHGSLEENWMLPTATGAIRPTCLAPETFIAGDLNDQSPMLLVGIDGYNDFYPHLAAANLQTQGIRAEAVSVNLPDLDNRKRIDAMVLAQHFGDHDSIGTLVEVIKPHLGGIERIGLPAVLGMVDAHGLVKTIELLLGCRVFEISGLPPSIPGMRLHQIMVDAIQKSGGQIFPGMEVISSLLSENRDRIEAVFTEAAARPTLHTAKDYILATGGVLGGGFSTNHTGAVYDPVFDLSIHSPPDVTHWLNQDFLHPDGHPIMGTGVAVNQNFKTSYQNLFAIGGALTGDFVREHSLEGVALVSGFRTAEVLA